MCCLICIAMPPSKALSARWKPRADATAVTLAWLYRANRNNIAYDYGTGFANETDYWIELLFQPGELSQESYKSIKPDIQELLKLLVSIVKTSKERAVK